MSPSPEARDPIQWAIAQIEAINREEDARKARIAADPICRALVAEMDRLRGPRPGYGNEGRDAVFASMLSPDRNRRARVRRLIFARSQQLSGQSAAKALREAAEFRRCDTPALTIQREETTIGVIGVVRNAHVAEPLRSIVNSFSPHVGEQPAADAMFSHGAADAALDRVAR